MAVDVSRSGPHHRCPWCCPRKLVAGCRSGAPTGCPERNARVAGRLQRARRRGDGHRTPAHRSTRNWARRGRRNRWRGCGSRTLPRAAGPRTCRTATAASGCAPVSRPATRSPCWIRSPAACTRCQPTDGRGPETPPRRSPGSSRTTRPFVLAGAWVRPRITSAAARCRTLIMLGAASASSPGRSTATSRGATAASSSRSTPRSAAPTTMTTSALSGAGSCAEDVLDGDEAGEAERRRFGPAGARRRRASGAAAVSSLSSSFSRAASRASRRAAASASTAAAYAVSSRRRSATIGALVLGRAHGAAARGRRAGRPSRPAGCRPPRRSRARRTRGSRRPSCPAVSTSGTASGESLPRKSTSWRSAPTDRAAAATLTSPSASSCRSSSPVAGPTTCSSAQPASTLARRSPSSRCSIAAARPRRRSAGGAAVDPQQAQHRLHVALRGGAEVGAGAAAAD